MAIQELPRVSTNDDKPQSHCDDLDHDYLQLLRIVVNRGQDWQSVAERYQNCYIHVILSTDNQ